MTNRIEIPLTDGDTAFVVKIDEFVCLHRVNKNSKKVEEDPFYKLPYGKKVTLIIEVK